MFCDIFTILTAFFATDRISECKCNYKYCSSAFSITFLTKLLFTSVGIIMKSVGNVGVSDEISLRYQVDIFRILVEITMRLSFEICWGYELDFMGLSVISFNVQ